MILKSLLKLSWVSVRRWVSQFFSVDWLGLSMATRLLKGEIVKVNFTFWFFLPGLCLRENLEKYLLEYKGEDWLASYVKRNDRPVFMVYFTPGDRNFILFRKHYLQAAAEYHK